MSAEWIKAMLADGCDEYDLGDVVKEGDWTDGGKWQTKVDVVRIDDNKSQFTHLPFKQGYYEVRTVRSGSYWSDYEYDDPKVVEVEPYEETITITKWRAVKNAQ